MTQFVGGVGDGEGGGSGGEEDGDDEGLDVAHAGGGVELLDDGWGEEVDGVDSYDGADEHERAAGS